MEEYNDVYIGERYVPKFIGIWDTTMSTTYEALSIVQHNNDTYTSKRPVPTGINILNTDYWVMTGNYNGQIASLNSRVTALENTILDPLNKKVILFGDSYMMGVGGNTNYDVELEIESLTGWDVKTYAEGGLGYIRTNGSGNKCIDMITAAIATETDRDTITDCVLACSVYNEIGMVGQPEFSEIGFYTAIRECVMALKSGFPNANITIIPALWCNVVYNDNFSKVSKWETLAAKNLGIAYVDNSINWLMVYESGVTSADNAHPTHQGYVYIAANIASVLRGVKPDLWCSLEQLTLNCDGLAALHVRDDSIYFSGQFIKRSGQTFTSLCSLPPICRLLSNYPIYLKRYDQFDPTQDLTALVVSGNTLYIGSDFFVEDATYIMEQRVPIVPFNP